MAAKIEDYQTKVNSKLKKQTKSSRIDKKGLSKLIYEYEHLDKDLQLFNAKLGAIYSIIAAADFGSEIHSEVEKLFTVSKSLTKELSDIIYQIENFHSLFEGRTSVYSEPTIAYKLLNKSFNLGFTVKTLEEGKVKFSCHQKTDTNNKQNAIVKAYSIVIAKEGEEIDPQSFEVDGPSVIRLNQENDQTISATIEVGKLMTIENRPLLKMYNYQAHLKAELETAFKKQRNNYNDFYSLPSYPFSISSEIKQCTPAFFLEQFKAFLENLFRMNDQFHHVMNIVVRRKAVNSLIPEELIESLQEGDEALQKVHKRNIKSLTKLMKLNAC